MMEDVRRWEGRVVEGRFPLRQYLGGSERSAVFLTGDEAHQNATIKLIPLVPGTADQQLACWKQAAELSHPNLIRLFEMGRCRIDDGEFLFVVMECAEEDLSQILPQRALTPGEAQEMLGPVVDVLRYLHGKGWVHGHLKPSNILALRDQVKLSSDRVGKVGERSSDAAKPGIYDAPEKAKGRNSAAGDVWSLGITLTEALTRQLPQPNGKDHSELRLPEGLSSPFLDIARNCLWRDPQQRWAVSEIAAQLGPANSVRIEKAVNVPEKTLVAPEPMPPATRSAEVRTASPAMEGNPRPGARWVWVILLLAVIAGGVYLARHRSADQSSSSTPAEQPAAQSAPKTEAPAPVAVPTQPQTSRPAGKKAPAVEASESGNEIVDKVVPSIPQSARGTIQGKVKVHVRVNVDASGKVVGSKFESRGPSEYFARQAKQAAEQWKFAPSQEGQRQWLLRFEFSRSGAQVFPSRIRR